MYSVQIKRIKMTFFSYVIQSPILDWSSLFLPPLFLRPPLLLHLEGVLEVLLSPLLSLPEYLHPASAHFSSTSASTTAPARRLTSFLKGLLDVDVLWYLDVPDEIKKSTAIREKDPHTAQACSGQKMNQTWIYDLGRLWRGHPPWKCSWSRLSEQSEQFWLLVCVPSSCNIEFILFPTFPVTKLSFLSSTVVLLLVSALMRQASVEFRMALSCAEDIVKPEIWPVCKWRFCKRSGLVIFWLRYISLW